MRTGKLDRKIIVQSLTYTDDGFGGFTTISDTVAVLRAEVHDKAGKELLSAGKELTEKTISFTVRYTELIKPTMQVVYEEQTYSIEGIEEIGRKKGLRIFCKAYTVG
ncbi:MAG: phage head closure protein [Alphaproteobacteria bacterium]|nr:phage head closure protein [Alphaproteobacteria bacterium]